LGIYGKWRFENFESVPEPVGLVRARFLAGNELADLRGPTACELLDSQQLAVVEAKLGPDPLDPKADAERFISRVLRSQTPIGQLLMDQSVIAGIGNVYRAELLFRAGINPYTPGKLLQAEQVLNLWLDAVSLMPLGVRTGLMLTREGFLKAKTLKADRYYVYKREGLPCRECGGNVAIDLMATRKLYFCPNCQK
jgi:endonuclease-8